MDTVNVNTDQPIRQDDVVILDDNSTVTASVDEVVINSSESTGNETTGLLPEIDIENDEIENPAGDILNAGMTLALVVSQVDGPLPGPADAAAVALAGATMLTAAVVHVGYEIYQFAHNKKKQSTGKSGSDRHDAQYKHGGKKRPENPNQRKGAEERRLKGKRTN